MKIIPVSLAGSSYNINIAEHALAESGALILPMLNQRRVIILTDTKVAALHLYAVQESLSASGISHATVTVEPGEASKSLAVLGTVLDEILSHTPERDTVLIALGGGVVGDLAGFAASIILRGVDFVQIPTTLLAQVDSSVGGKTGINMRQGKNLVGTFHQPRLVIADISLLSTLPGRQMRAGYAEVVKYGLINQPRFFEWLEKNGNAVLGLNADAVAHAVQVSCESKASIVSADEKESGVRALLNLGHSFAHALEAEVGYSEVILHGEAVAVGMAMAFTLSARLGLCTPGDAVRVKEHLEAMGLPVHPPVIKQGWDAPTLLAHMRHDKKNQNGKITLILARGIGKAFIARDVDEAEITSMLDDYFTS